MAYDNNAYCDFTTTTATAVAGKDILLCIFDNTGSELLAISGQQSLTINRSADSIEITRKDTQGGWKSKIAGMKEWSIDNDGIYSLSDRSHDVLSQAFENGDPVCLKVVNNKTKKGMFGGLAVITDYPLEAPYDDSMTYSLTLEGMGALVDLTRDPVTPDTMPEGSAALETLTVVSVPGATIVTRRCMSTRQWMLATSTFTRQAQRRLLIRAIWRMCPDGRRGTARQRSRRPTATRS